MFSSDSFFSVEGEMPGKENLSQHNANMQHEERVQSHIESGNMAADETALYILAKGSTGQKISMLQHLDRTIKDTSDERRVSQIVKELNAAIWTQDQELQVAAPGALKDVLPMFSEGQIHMLLSGSKMMLEVKTEEIRRAWSALVLEIIGHLPSDILVKEVVPLAMKKGEHSEPHDQRVFSCHCIGRLCRKLEAPTICSTVLGRAINLCQDTETSVRVAMCEQLGEVARAIGLEKTKERITAELFELLVDEEKLVSRSAFTSLIDLVEFFDPPYRREHFYPIIKSYITSPPEEVLSLLVDEFGRFLWKIRSDIQGADDVTLFANFFRQSAQKPDAEVRRLCAYNLPAVVASLPPTVYPTHLAQLHRALAADSHAPTRRAIAAGLHELCKLLGDRAAFYLRDSFLSLAQDSSLNVRTVAFRHLSEVLEIFAGQLKGDDRDSFFAALLPHIVSYEAAVHRDWRKVAQLLNSFEAFPRYFTGTMVHEKLIPLLMSHLLGGAAAVKEQCAGLVVLFTTKLHSNAMSVEVFSRIVSDFGRSPNCHNRAAYCQLFQSCAASYSRRFVRDRLLEPLLELSRDRVPGVRIHLVRTLPAVRRALKAPVDAEHVGWFNQAMQRLHSDDDAAVRAAMADIADEMDEIEKLFARHSAMRVTNAPDDVRDKQMEQAEGDLLDVAKEHEKLERRQKLREMLRSEATGSDAAPEGSGGKSGAGGKASGAKTGAGTGARRPPAYGGAGSSGTGAGGSSKVGAGGAGSRTASSTRTSSTTRSTVRR